mgnify:CR=1 FL=1
MVVEGEFEFLSLSIFIVDRIEVTFCFGYFFYFYIYNRMSIEISPSDSKGNRAPIDLKKAILIFGFRSLPHPDQMIRNGSVFPALKSKEYDDEKDE